jgi:hypothetical protein
VTTSRVIIVGAISPVDKDFIIMPYQDDEVLVPSRLPVQCFALSRTLNSAAALQTNGGDSVVSVTMAAHE